MTHRSSSILVVDDNPVNVRMLERRLTMEGYYVFTAFDGATARHLAQRERPDLIILDVMMPGESGFETIVLLKKMSETATIPVIFITGMDQLESKLQGFELGAVDYIIKPFQMEEVMARVRTHLRLSLATSALVTNQAAKLRQLEHAHTAILPQPEQMPEARFAKQFSSLLEAGGDFFDVVPITDGLHGYFVADVSGHDLSIAFVSSSLKALLAQNCKPMYQPVETMDLINRVLVEILAEGKFLTACYLLLNRRKNLATIVSMAHLPTLYIPVDGPPRLIQLQGDILGVFDNVSFGTETLQVKPGDRFVLYSDGLIERAAANCLWTETVEDLIPLAESLRDIDIESLPNAIFETFMKRLGKPDDDIVVLATEV